MHVQLSQENLRLLITEKSAKQYQQSMNALDLESSTEALGRLESQAGGDKDALQQIRESKEYKEIAKLQTLYNVKNEQLGLELQEINQQIDDFKALRDNSIKEATTWDCFN